MLLKGIGSDYNCDSHLGFQCKKCGKVKIIKVE